jgi:hypothetical protein
VSRPAPETATAVLGPLSNAAVTFLPWTAGNKNTEIVSSVKVAAAGAKTREGFA